MVIPDETGKSKQGLHLSTRYLPGEHMPVSGTVVSVPEKLIYNGYKINALKKKWCYDLPDACLKELMVLNDETLSVDVDMELQVGDKVWFHYQAIQDSVRMGMDRGNRFMFTYDNLYFAKRGEDIIMLNGHVLVEPVYKKMSEIIHTDDVRLKTEGIIARTGSPVRHYRSTASGTYEGYGDEGIQIKEGDRVKFKKNFDIFLEMPFYQRMPEKYYVMRKIDLLCVMSQ